MSKYRGYQHPTEPVTCSQCGREYPPNTAVCEDCHRYLINDWIGETATPDNRMQIPTTTGEDLRADIVQARQNQTDWDYLWHGQPPVSSIEHATRRTRRLAWRLAGILGAMYLVHLALPFPLDSLTGVAQRVQSTMSQPASSHQTSPAPASGQPITLHGTINAAGQATTPVVIWQYTHGHWVHEQGTALLDTGGGPQSILNGTALHAHGGRYNPALGTVQNHGVGTGSVTGYYWPHIFIAPLTAPRAYFVANQTVPSGLGSAIDSQEIVNIGLGTLDQGHFTVHGHTWVWTYRVQ